MYYRTVPYYYQMVMVCHCNNFHPCSWVGMDTPRVSARAWDPIVVMADNEALFPNNRYTEIVYVNVGRYPLKVDVPKGGVDECRRLSCTLYF